MKRWEAAPQNCEAIFVGVKRPRAELRSAAEPPHLYLRPIYKEHTYYCKTAIFLLDFPLSVIV
jgi:hypothetical protein